MITEFAPAKINLALHVTGQRNDGYHLLDSLVVFADVGDRLAFQPSDTRRLTITGPFSDGVPTGPDNLIWKAVDWFDPTLQLDITLEKTLPHAAGIGGGSADAGAVIRALRQWRPGGPDNGGLVALGADVPVCTLGVTSRMGGIGEDLRPVPRLPPLPAVIVNPRALVPTAKVFSGLNRKDNSPMSMPDYGIGDRESFIHWLSAQRNDLEKPALTFQPLVRDVLSELTAQMGCALSRMSGSGATCFGLFPEIDAAKNAARRIAASHSDWWVQVTTLADHDAPGFGTQT
ncbi:MAG: 4-(cytidine 5'-diphospho)-2-C-methyl-D-erythritol kinase [Pseudomonadota bacterium]